MDNTVTRPAIFYLTVSHWRVSRRCSLLLTNSSSSSNSNSSSSSSSNIRYEYFILIQKLAIMFLHPWGCMCLGREADNNQSVMVEIWNQRSFQPGVFNLILSGTKKDVAKVFFNRYAVIIIHLLCSADCVCYSLLFPHNGREILFWLGQAKRAKCTMGARLDYDCLNLTDDCCLSAFGVDITLRISSTYHNYCHRLFVRDEREYEKRKQFTYFS
ncbi:hypothetical protein T05_7599 [Trichinella murrelli]|uniref:Uncharacterized protein n=1 Tax=Trichinella murrelli TaxID=144512 RepID=A0A0V0TKM0_9BILA|nr:hypothetical protein T05_7599 [Trichinella murrelli]